MIIIILINLTSIAIRIFHFTGCLKEKQRKVDFHYVEKNYPQAGFINNHFKYIKNNNVNSYFILILHIKYYSVVVPCLYILVKNYLPKCTCEFPN